MKNLLILAICVLGTSVMVNAKTMSSNVTHLKEVVTKTHSKNKPVKKVERVKKVATPKS